MCSSIITVLLWAAALGSGLMLGVCFALSGFVMKAFNGIEVSRSVAAMKAVNETILRSIFMPLFLRRRLFRCYGFCGNQ